MRPDGDGVVVMLKGGDKIRGFLFVDAEAGHFSVAFLKVLIELGVADKHSVPPVPRKIKQVAVAVGSNIMFVFYQLSDDVREVLVEFSREEETALYVFFLQCCRDGFCSVGPSVCCEDQGNLFLGGVTLHDASLLHDVAGIQPTSGRW